MWVYIERKREQNVVISIMFLFLYNYVIWCEWRHTMKKNEKWKKPRNNEKKKEIKRRNCVNWRRNVADKMERRLEVTSVAG